ncbi:tyrosine-type recombinase/integrase [Tepidibacter mesophilus]|uniref:tyrosine-type recombinase/integrase n=1 Tax=Tepidibacter mesophilus TaxID=655607 RepID=UPI001A9A5C2E|nr:site-specific integrase [Tepidibacter mesophilus]
MNNLLNTLGYDNINEYENKINDTLSGYIEKVINKDGSVDYKEIKTSYFLENDKWHVDFFKNIPQFKEQIGVSKASNTNIYFSFNNPNINKEIKFFVHSKLFSDEWRYTTFLQGRVSRMRRLAMFINEKYPSLNSILDLNINKVDFIWINWLHSQGINTTVTLNSMNKRYQSKNPACTLIQTIYTSLFNLVDEREEWDKDIWNIRNLKQYRISYVKSTTNYYINFNKIVNIRIRTEIKKYMKQRLITNHKFSWSTAIEYLSYLSNFVNLIFELEPTWNDFKKLERLHIEKYLEWLNSYVKENSTRKNANPSRYINKSLSIVQKFLNDIQIRECDIAPKKNMTILIYPSDKHKINKKPYDQIDYVPNVVLEQLFDNINNLHKEVIPIVWIMYKTGLRISDILQLKQNCLVKLNNKFWIVANISKTYIEGHKIPIDDELASMLAVLIHNAKKLSNQDNNPENFIFVRYKGRRKGKPYFSLFIQNKLNILALNYNITDKLGNIYHFKNHPFRHTYAIKMLNGGADIFTVQELLAHASPEMTMRYAKLLDDTKRKVFDNAIKQGVFSFDESNKLKEKNNGEIPTNILDMLWTNHKLNAIDTPYGTCLQRTNGKCQFAKQPPCLTCNGGNPCRDLCVGAFEGDVHKYEILINSTKSMIESAKVYNRIDMIKENEELLNLYEDIHSKIVEGNIVYSRLDRLKKKGDTNG